MSAPLQLDSPIGSGRPWRRLLWPVAIALLGFAVLPLDLPIAWWFRVRNCPAEINRWLQFFEVYAHGFGVACIVSTIFVLNAGRQALLLLVALDTFRRWEFSNRLKPF